MHPHLVRMFGRGSSKRLRHRWMPGLRCLVPIALRLLVESVPGGMSMQTVQPTILGRHLEPLEVRYHPLEGEIDKVELCLVEMLRRTGVIVEKPEVFF